MNKTALFSLAFRPFFLLATVFACVLMLGWVWVYLFSSQLSSFSYYPMTVWHAHEMIFAYSMAVVAGFLLTAIKNWTGIQTVNGTKLMLLTVIWVLARIAPFIITVPWLIALIDLLFLPILAVFVAIPLVRAGNRRNYFMIALVLIMAVLNLLLHLDLLGVTSNLAISALGTAFYLLIALIIVMAARVVPMFSQNGVANRYQVNRYVLIEKLAMPSYFIFMLAVVFVRIAPVTMVAGLLVAVIHAIRLKGWYNRQIWQVPLVWVLHVGYLFLIVGFLMTAISAYIPMLHYMALHVFSIGTLGLITVGMMARVSIGHTGRNLRQPPKSISSIFLLLIAAVITRSLLPIFVPQFYHWAIIISGLMWALAFVLFVVAYLQILIKPRVDVI
jgi:uncharacterized protein involved in response to NO